MKKYLSVIILCLLVCFGCNKRKNKGKQTNGKDNNQQVQDLVVDSASVKKYMSKWSERRDFGDDIQRFYRNRNYEIAWFEDGKPLPHIEIFINKIREVELDGLKASDFPMHTIDTLYSQAKNSKFKEGETVKNLDLVLTTYFFKYTSQIYHGITEDKSDLSWFIERDDDIVPDSLLAISLNQKVTEEKKNPFFLVDPLHREYHQLREVVIAYTEFAKSGGWKGLEGVKKLKFGDTSDRVSVLREELSITGDLRTSPGSAFNPKIFDKTVEEGVKAFQTRHGLEPDGVVAGKTLATLSIPIEKRINQLKVNMERWRMLPRKFADTFLMVNVPEFKFYIFENGKQVLDMRVVVGKEFNSTPVFMDQLDYIVFSPFWNVPKSILIEEVIPAVRRDNSFLYKNKMEVVKGYNNPEEVVPYWSVPWGQVSEDNFPYRIRQRPGKDNPLGLVKFIFPNQYNIYLHDTPSDYLFDRVQRAYSHGCIRVARPMDLAKYLLKNQTQWTEASIKKAMIKGEEQYVNIRPKLQVYILYFTTWVDANGIVHFRDDIYGFDKALNNKLGLN